jgi:hypothetical protein
MLLCLGCFLAESSGKKGSGTVERALLGRWLLSLFIGHLTLGK